MQCESPASDCFDKFSDDLMPLLLSYLPITDCFRLQRVSRRFDAHIFNSQTTLALSRNAINKNSVIDQLFTRNRNQYFWEINKQSLNYVLIKCVNIKHITIGGKFLRVTEQTLRIISNNCKHIKHLSIEDISTDNVSRESWQRFAEHSLKNIETLKITNFGDEMFVTAILQFTPKLKKINTFRYDSLHISFDKCFQLNNNQQLLKNFESVKEYRICDEKFIAFADYFAHRLKSLHVLIDDNVNNDIFKHLTHFDKLEYLYCGLRHSFYPRNYDQNCIEMIKQIGLKCRTIKALGIDWLNEPFYAIIGNQFKSIEKLVLVKISIVSKITENISLLRNCVRLTHLQFDGSYIEESDFKDIHLYLPQLVSIDIFVHKDCDHIIETINHLMQHLSRLPNLRDLKIGGSDGSKLYSISTDTITSFIDNCLSVRRIGVHTQSSSDYMSKICDYISDNNRKIVIHKINKVFHWP